MKSFHNIDPATNLTPPISSGAGISHSDNIKDENKTKIYQECSSGIKTGFIFGFFCDSTPITVSVFVKFVYNIDKEIYFLLLIRNVVFSFPRSER
ncbi:hypothetical protein JTE90_000116 [Oedothorax gibbosus]|uniref:Uncharacterized protein n=1 Tax=Oedothorax gibbosus TaxID=931172 RepID=A0AAV6UZR5_9ARAC|nr:hypothetical protein JTE90_000116 [Oedothorax gibbosus]